MSEKTKAMVKAPERKLTYHVGDQEVSLTASVILDLLVKGDRSKVSNAEVWQFGLMCQHQKLDPFVGDAYLVKYGNDAQMLTSKAAFLKRAESCPEYRGFEAGITVDVGGELVQRPGSLVPPGAKLAGAWARVYRSDRDYPAHAEVSASEYNKGRSTWKDIPATMLRKVAIVHAMREAFPAQLGGLYSEDEMNSSGASARAGNTGSAAALEERLSKAKAKAKPVEDAEYTDTEGPEEEALDHEEAALPPDTHKAEMPDQEWRDAVNAAIKRFGRKHVDSAHEALALPTKLDKYAPLEKTASQAALQKALSYEGAPPEVGSDLWEAYVDSLKAEVQE